ncbi:DUF4488 domain-containing protein [Sphingobacterium cavernae]|uniref:DUF4488 domain-containing protein n=1 Tax=Sphingobacterium cavernae TaxID=2592657 RepID=UPI001230117A|nr:DUF4488 domain-containing protein [Sphingobacterium cavernae]
MKRIALLTTFLVALFTLSFAQDKPLTGIWELKKSKDGQGNLNEIPIGAYKIFTNDGKFFNMQLTADGAVITHEGIFQIDGAAKYTENVLDKITGSYIDEKQTNLTYKLSEDGNTLTLEGVLKLGDGNYTFNLYEEWKKVLVYNP